VEPLFGHAVVYPPFDVRETAVERVVDEFVIGDRLSVLSVVGRTVGA
jgi:hypothetical protein